MSISPPFDRLPSLNALRAFEAAARLGSFRRAADELMVTPGAVAAQIKALEAEFGAELFHRQARGVTLTALGQRVAPRFSAAFDALGGAVRELRRYAAPRKVHIVTSPALAQLWVAPRLLHLRAALRDADISVTALEEPPDLKRTPFDLCLFYAEPGPDKITLWDEQLLPVCIPALAEALADPADLAMVNCISDVVWQDWRIWAASAMPDSPVIPTGPGFSLYAVAVQEALSGAGVLMGRQSLVQPHLNSGALIAPFDLPVPLGLSITAWMLPESRNDRAVIAVANGLRQIAGGMG
ncbi:UNVERIFIED_ORG: LysR family glycine cleavage system transcriptional activator [Rhizobium esperanzae]|uniref:LysR family transcriptional regulator n=1 Tax=Rhizobium phaseoli TaxID=396 RepID=UPI0004DA3AC2|nr:LysR family transcriptional regulator [Rhizobium phaseoli]KEC75315.1 LysR family transcriptional regulator [Rhizobium leguminosarum bv. phaseoli CCGM1]PWI54741.1 LysR family transcriptional regulator [Rhizobium phaseoli]